ncbi:hypothetical protein X975_18381, partial [Stegodyphus mimosarum]
GCARFGKATLGSIFLPSSSWVPLANTLSTLVGSANVTKPKP